MQVFIFLKKLINYVWNTNKIEKKKKRESQNKPRKKNSIKNEIQNFFKNQQKKTKGNQQKTKIQPNNQKPNISKNKVFFPTPALFYFQLSLFNFI